MRGFEYYSNMDEHPFVGIRETNFKAKISRKTWLDEFFNKTPNVEQVKNVTRGKTYRIIKVEGLGDVACFFFENDVGKEIALSDFFFEKAE